MYIQLSAQLVIHLLALLNPIYSAVCVRIAKSWSQIAEEKFQIN